MRFMGLSWVGADQRPVGPTIAAMSYNARSRLRLPVARGADVLI
jgi:hypothetical protein